MEEIEALQKLLVSGIRPGSFMCTEVSCYFHEHQKATIVATELVSKAAARTAIFRVDGDFLPIQGNAQDLR